MIGRASRSAVPRQPSRIASLLSLRSLRWGAGFALVTGVALCAVPLFGTLGPEGALVLGVLLPPWAAAIAARLTARARSERMPSSVLLCQAVACAWLLVTIPVVLLALNALRFKTCEPFAGLSFIALGPWAGSTLAAVVGVAIGSSMQRAWLATLLAVATPPVAIIKAIYDFMATPGIFALGRFFGYFPGTFYDRRIEIPAAWLQQRALDLLIGAALWALVVAFRDRRTGLLRPQRGGAHPVILSLAVAATLGAVFVERSSLERGQRTSTALIEARLGLVIDSARCRVVLPRELDMQQAQRLARDCDFRVGQLEARLGVRETERVTAFFFRSAHEKRQLMGAARVYIAKPWRREVYLQLADFPHPVLAHELAHIVARHAARGPFGIAGHLGGLIPEPTLIEGLAVALEPTARDELTAHQWAKAAHLAKVAPSLQAMLGPSFFGKNQAMAYTLAGSFLRHVLDTRGPKVVREIYRRADVIAVLKQPWSALEAEWHAALDRVPLPDHAQALAAARFERPGVFSQVCPHTVERLEAELAGALNAGDTTRAIAKCRAVLEIDPNDMAVRATLITTLARTGSTGAAQRQLSQLSGKLHAPSPIVSRARVGLADAASLRGDHSQAEQAYKSLLAQPLPEAELRQIEVKLLGIQAGDPVRSYIAELLIGTPGRNTDIRTSMHAIHQISTLRKDGLGPYLAARQLSAAGRDDLAKPLFDEAFERGLATRRLRVEAHRLRGISAFNIGELDEALQSFDAIAALNDVSLAEQLEAQDWKRRIAFWRAH